MSRPISIFRRFSRDNDHHVHHDDEEGETAHAGDVTNLDESDVLMESDSEAVPAESKTTPRSHSRAVQAAAASAAMSRLFQDFSQIGLVSRRRLARFRHRAYEERPEGRIDAEIKAECYPARDR